MRLFACAIALMFIAMVDSVSAQQAPTAEQRARIEHILRATPLIDGHNDLAEQIQERYAGDPQRVDLNADTAHLAQPLHTDIPRLRAGHVGAQFWSVYVPAELQGPVSGEAVRVQMDIVRRVIARYPNTFEFATTAA